VNYPTLTDGVFQEDKMLSKKEKSRPEYIIHTGDLVDNIKLER